MTNANQKKKKALFDLIDSLVGLGKVASKAAGKGGAPKEQNGNLAGCGGCTGPNTNTNGGK